MQHLHDPVQVANLHRVEVGNRRARGSVLRHQVGQESAPLIKNPQPLDRHHFPAGV
ncbi:hypothetical protein [Neolewinella sp.]|uniref:hypothetical protein n=1 Tax=Neolewinella sp. TaxID=2993543 RepID=UPI003B516CDD